METTRRQLTAAIVVLAEHPESWERLAADPGSVADRGRRDPAVPADRLGGLTRRAEEPFERDDLAVDQAGRLLLSFTTANRDPAAFERPDQFDVRSRPCPHAHAHLRGGPHLCVGAGLARLELAEALGALTSRFGPPAIEERRPGRLPGPGLATRALPGPQLSITQR